MRKQPQYQCGRQVPFEVVPHQQQAQPRQQGRQRDAILQPSLPLRPHAMIGGRIRHRRRCRQPIEHRSQFLIQPRVQHRIGRSGNALGAQLATARAKQGQQLGRAVAHVFMGLALRLALLGPALP